MGCFGHFGRFVKYGSVEEILTFVNSYFMTIMSAIVSK